MHLLSGMYFKYICLCLQSHFGYVAVYITVVMECLWQLLRNLNPTLLVLGTVVFEIPKMIMMVLQKELEY